MLFAAVGALAFLAAASAQTVHTVKVGATASDPGGIYQFIPNNINATNGDVINFQFTGIPGNHSITQSSFSDPCDPLANGFDSGWLLILQAAPQVPMWNLTVTDDTKPIWFYCKQLLPGPHCTAGMVGAINAPTTGNTFSAYQTNAQNFQGLPGQGQNGLVGVGASAAGQISPVPSGDIFATGAPFTPTTGGASTGGANPSATAPSGSTTSAPAAGGASNLVTNSFVGLIAVAVGVMLA